MPFQDFKNDWTELDPATFINADIDDTRADYIDLPLNIDAYFSRDFGGGHFTNFTHLITCYMELVTGLSSSWSGYSLGATVDDLFGQSDALQVVFVGDGGFFDIMIRDASDNDRDDFSVSGGTLYYLKPTRNGTAWSVEIYDDSGRTNLIATPAVTGTNTAFRYGLVAQSGNTASGDRKVTGYWKDLDLQEGAAVSLLMMKANQLGNIGHRLTGGMQL